MALSNIIVLDKGTHFLEVCFFFPYFMLYLISFIFIFAIENDCVSNIPWCSVVAVVPQCSHKRTLFPKQWTFFCTKTNELQSLRHLIATNIATNKSLSSKRLSICASEIWMKINYSSPKTPENPLCIPLGNISYIQDIKMDIY